MKPIKGLPDDGPPCGCVIEMADSGEPVNRPCAAHARLGAQHRSARGAVYDVPVAGKFRTVPTGLPKELPSGEPEVVVFPPRSQGTSKPGRGGRRANQKGRPRKLHDPVSRSFTLERRLVERLEVLASLTGRPVADVCRSALELGVKNLEWGQHDKP